MYYYKAAFAQGDPYIHVRGDKQLFPYGKPGRGGRDPYDRADRNYQAFGNLPRGEDGASFFRKKNKIANREKSVFFNKVIYAIMKQNDRSA